MANGVLEKPQSKNSIPSAEELASIPVQEPRRSYTGDNPAIKQQMASQLNSARAKAAMEQGRLVQTRRAPQSDEYLSRPEDTDRLGQRSKTLQRQRAELAQAQADAGEAGLLDRLGLGARARARRFIASKREQEKLQEAEARKKDYPTPLRLMNFFAWAPFAIAQDLIPLIADIIGIGWILGYALLPITWFTYWALIIRYTPYSMRRKFWMRSAVISSIGWIPVVGEITPEWIATLLGSAYLIYNYERGRTSFTAAAAGGVGINVESATAKQST